MIDTPVRNQQAFPTLESNGERLILTDAGMTLRDYFAAEALDGLLASLDKRVWDSEDSYGAYVARKISKFSYLLADAMLEERIKQ